MYGNAYEETVRRACDCLNAIHASEKEWIRAQEDAKSAIIIEGVAVRVVGVQSDSQAVMKAGRALQSTIVVARTSAGLIGITATAGEKWKEPDLTNVAALLRLTDCKSSGQPCEVEHLFLLDESAGWFLHSSRRILSRGSWKRSNITPTNLSLEEVCALAAIALYVQYPWPARFQDLQAEWETILKTRKYRKE